MSGADYVDLPEPAGLEGAEKLAWDLLLKRFAWYSRHASGARWGYLSCRICESSLAAAITVGGAVELSS